MLLARRSLSARSRSDRSLPVPRLSPQARFQPLRIEMESESVPLQVVNQLPHCLYEEAVHIRGFPQLDQSRGVVAVQHVPIKRSFNNGTLQVMHDTRLASFPMQRHRECVYGGTSGLSGNPAACHNSTMCETPTLHPTLSDNLFTAQGRIWIPKTCITVEPLALVDCLLDVGLFW